MITLIVVTLLVLSLTVWNFHIVTISDAYTRLFSSIEDDVKSKISETVGSEVESLRAQVESLRKLAEENTTRLEVKVGDRLGMVEGVKHKQLSTIITLAANRLPTMMVGMAGTGKTHAGRQAAEALGLPFYAMSVGAQTSKSDIMGFMNASGDYVETLFRRAVEHGGLIIIDEIDAGNANVLIQMNAVLANEYCAFPDQMVKKHDDFVLVAAANTFGTGANRQYVGRNQLDAATLDRFSMLEWEIDPALEKHLAGEQLNWYNAMIKLREHVTQESMRVLVTPRATQRGARMLAAGMKLDDVMEMAVVSMFPNDKKEKARSIIRSGYNLPVKQVSGAVGKSVAARAAEHNKTQTKGLHADLLKAVEEEEEKKKRSKTRDIADEAQRKFMERHWLGEYGRR